MTSDRASDFWQRAGGVPLGYPRDIERAVSLALPVAIVKLPRVTVRAVTEWFDARGRGVQVGFTPQDLAGCVVAHGGKAIVFVCGADPEDELRITIAHEIAHVMVHYLEPREAAVRSVGPAVTEVLDGLRAATVEERVVAVIASVRLGAHVHLLRRGDAGWRAAAVDMAEEEADRLALELVAPRREVQRMLRGLRRQIPTPAPHDQRAILGERFGVPAEWFAGFAPELPARRSDRFTDHLFSTLRG